MSLFASTPRPETSPWGPVQQADQLAPGIWSVMTASHGGLLLSDARQTAMPDALRLDAPVRVTPDTRPCAFPQANAPRKRVSKGISKPRSDQPCRTRRNHPGKPPKPEGGPRWHSITKT